jgi:hypothetical protein
MRGRESFCIRGWSSRLPEILIAHRVIIHSGQTPFLYGRNEFELLIVPEDPIHNIAVIS